MGRPYVYVVRTSHLSLFSERRKELVPGVALLMSDGALWFHPSNGDTPWEFGAWEPGAEIGRCSTDQHWEPEQ